MSIKDVGNELGAIRQDVDSMPVEAHRDAWSEVHWITADLEEFYYEKLPGFTGLSEQLRTALGMTAQLSDQAEAASTGLSDIVGEEHNPEATAMLDAANTVSEGLDRHKEVGAKVAALLEKMPGFLAFMEEAHEVAKAVESVTVDPEENPDYVNFWEDRNRLLDKIDDYRSSL